MGLFRVLLLQSYKWIGLGLGLGWDLCTGLFYEHRFAMLIMCPYVRVWVRMPTCVSNKKYADIHHPWVQLKCFIQVC